MATYVEEREFSLRLEIRHVFADTYDGDDDGYEWTDQIPPLVNEVVRAAMNAISRHPGWSVRPRNRGRSPEDEVTLVLEKQSG